jgi:hypothetical protein
MEKFDFPANVKNGVKKRISNVNVKQFESEEFNISIKELTRGRIIATHGTNYVLYDGAYRGSQVAVKVMKVVQEESKEYINTLVDLTAFAALPHENVAAFYGAGYSCSDSGNIEEVSAMLLV